MTSRFAVVVSNSWINGYICVFMCVYSTVMAGYFGGSDLHIWS